MANTKPGGQSVPEDHTSGPHKPWKASHRPRANSEKPGAASQERQPEQNHGRSRCSSRHDSGTGPEASHQRTETGQFYPEPVETQNFNNLLTFCGKAKRPARLGTSEKTTGPYIEKNHVRHFTFL